MKRLLAILLLLLPLFAVAKHNKEWVTFLTKDSLHYIFEENWRFHPGDSAIWVLNDYNDSLWEDANCNLLIQDEPTKVSQNFNGIGWFRLHIRIDSSLVGIPLALRVTHYGASEVYFDGKKIKAFGTINGKDSSVYYDPQDIPFIFVIPSAGNHLIAVRYANYNARQNYEKYYKQFAGFKMRLGTANGSIQGDREQTLALSILLIFLFSAFFALALIHLFLYLYYRAERSNLFFSIFSLSLSLLFFTPFLSRFVTTPEIEVRMGFIALVLTSATCFSLSGFNNELFATKRLRFRLITLLCIVSPILLSVKLELGAAYFALIVIVMLESVILTIRAIYKKIRGARIIGFGILFFALFFLTITALALIFNGVDINDNTTSGQIVELFAMGAILSMPLSMSIYLAWNFGTINKDLKNQLQQVKLLSAKTLEQEREKKQMLENRKEELEKEVTIRTEEVMAQKQEIEKQHTELKIEKKKSDDLLLNILPEEIAEELKEKGVSEARFFDHVSVLFTDFVDFTKAGERMSPKELVDELHTCFKAFDEIISKYNIEKIKTIGDAYLAVCGLPVSDVNHAVSIAKAAMQILDFMTERRKRMGDKTFDIRIGIHSGSVVAGIVGVKKFAYDIWGDTVNTAARMEQNSETGKINVSQVTYELIKDRFLCTFRGEITAKNKGAMSMYYIEKEI